MGKTTGFTHRMLKTKTTQPMRAKQKNESAIPAGKPDLYDRLIEAHPGIECKGVNLPIFVFKQKA